MKNMTRESILWYALIHQGQWSKIAQSIRDHDAFQKVSYEIPYVTVLDPEYPACFRTCRYPPWILFYQGNLSWLKMPGVAIIGSRHCTQAALDNTRLIVNQIKTRYSIVSGLAKGIDAMAHRASLDQKTIGIIGCGLDRVYPKENQDLYRQMREHHLIISEYPLNVPPMAKHFPWRNRLIAAACRALIVVQAEYKSGTMHTVNECLELSKPIYCVPSAFEQKGFKGCNYLIQNGAQILVDLEDLREI